MGYFHSVWINAWYNSKEKDIVIVSCFMMLGRAKLCRQETDEKQTSNSCIFLPLKGIPLYGIWNPFELRKKEKNQIFFITVTYNYFFFAN